MRDTGADKVTAVCLLVGCFTSQQQASVSQGRMTAVDRHRLHCLPTVQFQFELNTFLTKYIQLSYFYSIK